MSACPLRPLGTQDLAALRSAWAARLAVAVRLWLVEPTLQITDLSATPALLRPDGDKACWPLGQGANLQVGPASLSAVCRLCVLPDGRPSSLQALEPLHQALARRALIDMAQAMLALPIDSDPPGPDTGPDLGGVQVTLALANHTLAIQVPRTLLAPQLAAPQPGARKLAAVRLPDRLGQARHTVQVRSRPFEVRLPELVGLKAGDVIVMEQALDAPLRFAIDALPGLALDAFVGRRGDALAVEVLAPR